MTVGRPILLHALAMLAALALAAVALLGQCSAPRAWGQAAPAEPGRGDRWPALPERWDIPPRQEWHGLHSSRLMAPAEPAATASIAHERAAAPAVERRARFRRDRAYRVRDRHERCAVIWHSRRHHITKFACWTRRGRRHA